MTYRLLNCFWKLLSYTPLCVMYVLSDGLFYPLYHLVRYRRKVVRKNLVESFPEKSLPEIIKIEKRFYRFFIDLIFETCKMATMSSKTMRKRMKFNNIEGINAVFEQGKSIAAYMGHCGNWEWVTSLPLHLNQGIVAGQIYQKLRNESVDRLLFRNRERLGAVCIEMKETLRRINELVNSGKMSIIAYITDQSPRKEYIQHYVPFLHHHTPALIGTEKLVKRYDFEAWYLDVKRVKRGYYEAEFVRLHDSPQSLPDFELTDMYYRHLEQIIIRQPELYLWSHKRFKYAQKLDE